MRSDARETHRGEPPLQPLSETLEFMRLLWAIDHALQQRSKRMAATLGVTGPQRLVIRVLGRSPGISAGRLARVLHLHPSTLTGILRRLEQKGLMTRERDARDLRRAVLHLSAAGRRLDVETAGTVESAMKAALARVPARQVKAAREVLCALADEIQPRPGSSRAGSRRGPAAA